VDIPGMAFTPKVQGTPWESLSLKEILRQSITAVEREVLTEVLKTTGGNKAKAARLLQVDYKTIHEKVKKLGIMNDRDENLKKPKEPGLPIKKIGTQDKEGRIPGRALPAGTGF